MASFTSYHVLHFSTCVYEHQKGFPVRNGCYLSSGRHSGRKQSIVLSHNRRADIQLGWPGNETFFQREGACADTGGRYDVLGLGQAMIDFSAAVSDELLAELHVEKGARRLISLEDRGDILERLDGETYHISTGGSLSNTLVALARLGASTHPNRLRIGMAGLIGSDALGSFYTAKMQSAGVDVISPPSPAAHTGTVVVLTSPDAQRTMLSYLGTPAPVTLDPRLEEAIGLSSILVIEGYLWELPEARATIGAAIAAAKLRGTIVAMTAGDAGVVERHSEEMWEAIDAGIDLLFTNAGEAAELVARAPAGKSTAPSTTLATSSGRMGTAEASALALGPHCSLVCVTDGSAGSVLTALGELHVVPPHWMESPPVDTCGAGDAYAAGLLYGFLRGYDVQSMGRTAARAASAVISRHGARLGEKAAAAIVALLPAAAESQFRSAPTAFQATVE